MTKLWYQSVNANLPIISDEEKKAAGIAHWQEACAKIQDPDQQAIASNLIKDPMGNAILAAIYANSPFLSLCINKDISFACDLLHNGPDETFLSLTHQLNQINQAQFNREDVSRNLRIIKRQAALTIALADICQVWTVKRITDAITTVAEKSLDCASGVILREGHRRGYFKLEDPDNNPQKNSGLIILGMGKLGGRELNYSSDVDIIVLYDQEVIETEDRWELQSNIVRLTKQLVQIMDERTADGYVFRTDLRLRPDPGSTPLAISVLAAETYYESIGQNWERAAMIKARPVAGDIEAGYRFLETLRPFMWRKYMDFAAIQDIHAIKRQINAHKGSHTISLAGHNVKLGRGGIREIEFYAQTQQLIWGGRLPETRIAPTCKALRALVKAELLDSQICDELISSYKYLRTVEHRIQMTNDEQTHAIPTDPEGVRRLANFMGYADDSSFAEEFIPHLERVESYFAALFEETDTQSPETKAQGNLVFTGEEADPDTLDYLAQLGFDNPELIDRTIRAWHHARYRATRSVRAREILTALMPKLIEALAKTAEPGRAFLRFDDFLSKLPAGVQLFSMFQVNPQLLDLVADIMGDAPALADHLAKNSGLLEFVLTKDFYTPLPCAEALKADLSQTLEQARDYQDIIDMTRRWANDRKFQVGVQSLRNVVSIRDSGYAQTNIAEAILQTLLPLVQKELAQKHGIIEGGDMCVIAMGKAGSREMTATSDLDLVFVYDTPPQTNASNGERPLSIAPYYARLSQRYINALSALTGEGMLYEVDMRLRPSGNSGPIASSIESFSLYQHDSAWTWEHMALTRARVICGSKSLKSKVEGVIKDILCQERPKNDVLFDVYDMRERMDGEHHTDVIWNIKHFRGGIVDIDFMAQYLQLAHGAETPTLLHANSRNVLKNARDLGLLDKEIANDLIYALELWNIVQGYMRLTVAAQLNSADEQNLSPSLKKELATATGEPSFDMLRERMKNAADQVRRHYDTLIGNPGALIAKSKEQN